MRILQMPALELPYSDKKPVLLLLVRPAKGDERKRIFSLQLLHYVPLAAHIRRVFDERPTHVARNNRSWNELEDSMSEDNAQRTLRAMISLGRYAEAFASDDENAVFSLENPS
jgi:NitT/TauT family transport system ATP-binding protein